ncbi:MAG: polysaccharide deacetylase family protein [Calditrichia bacterium]
MSRSVTIIAYHYIRQIKKSRYPDIKGLAVEKFKGQLDYFKKNFNLITPNDFLNALSNVDYQLPPAAMLLTFDDGYIDHFENAYPELSRREISGFFFPAAKAIVEEKVLDVNKIHFILASIQDKSFIIKKIFEMISEYKETYHLEDPEYYWQKHAKRWRFDSKEVIFIKRILQKELPECVRKRIADKLFRKYVTCDEKAFSRELYMDIPQLKVLHANGMSIASHGYSHCWLDKLNRDSQEAEIDLSKEFLNEFGSAHNHFIICYPYGAYNDSLLSILRGKKCVAGFSTHIGVANLNENTHLALPRMRPNDFPTEV